MLTFPLTGVPADQHEPSWELELLLHPAECGNQPIKALYRREATRVDQHRSGRQRRHIFRGVAQAARRLTRSPASRLFNEHPPPECLTIERRRGKQVSIDPVGDGDDPLAWYVEQRHGTLHPGRRDDQPRAFVSPSAYPLRPLCRVRPLWWVGVGDPFEHQQLGSMELTDDRDVRSHPSGGLVERGEMVQMQHIRIPGSGVLERPRPCSNLQLVLVIIERREHAIGRADPILERRMQGRAPGRPSEPVRGIARQRRIEIDRAHLPVESVRVAVRAQVGAGTGHERHLTALPPQPPGERASCVRRAPARGKQNG